MPSPAVTGRLARLVLVLLLATPAVAQMPAEVSSRLGHAARVLAEAVEVDRLTPEARYLAPFTDVTVRRDGRVMAGVLVQLESGSSVETLRATGLEIRATVGDIVAGRVDARNLAALAATPGVRSVELGRMYELLNDLGGAAIDLPSVHGGVGLPQGYRGEDVVVGVIDTGIDFTHPDFSDASGTRIEYLLEFLPDDDNQPPLLEVEWTRGDIDNAPATVTQKDINGHGTHVAGTAAGGGVGNSRFIGAAPESRLVVVKATRTSDDADRPAVFSEIDLISAVAYVFERADDLDMPAVVNLSIGRHGGPLDGTEPGVAAISNLAADGRIVVFAGGNDGAGVIHWGTDLVGSDDAAMAFSYGGSFTVPGYGQYLSLTGWYEPEAVAEITLHALHPTSFAEVASISVAVGSQLDDWEALTAGNGDVLGHARILALTTEHPWNGDGTFQVGITQLGDENIDLEDVIWAVSLSGGQGGRVDVWIDVRAMGSFLEEVPASIIPGDRWLTLNRYGGGENIIVAGAFASRTEWTMPDGNHVETAQTLGHRASFSSFGPTRDGRVRPDVLAPGTYVASALSSDAPGFGQPMQDVAQYRLAQGTSMAAPFLAGTVALMLQVDPDLSVEQARSLLRASAEWAPYMGELPNGAYGYGLLDALAVVQATLASTYVEPPPEGFAVVVEPPFPNPVRSATTLPFALAQAGRAEIILHDVLGREVRRLVDEQLRAGPHLLRLELGDLSSGMYLLSVRSAGRTESQRLMVVR